MIKYTLLCDNKHEFEGWFPSSAGYERQAQAGQISCPSCGNDKVSKALMTPNVVSSDKRTKLPETLPAEVVGVLRNIRRQVTENADYVGPRFAEEARKIHFQEIEPRGIYGEATAADVKTLLEDGVEVHPLPVLPEDQN